MSVTANTPPRPSAALIVLNWNGRHLLESCLPSLFASDYPNFDVILVDNGSEDDSVSYTKDHFPKAIILQNSANLGFPQGMNSGLAYALAADYDILVSVNNDVVVPAGWLAALVEGLTAAPDIAIAGSKLLYPDGRTIQHAGGGLTRPRALSFHYHQHEPDEGQVDTSREVDYVTGAAMAVRAGILRQIGLFDETFGPFYYEEVDLCRRAREAGGRVVLVPQAAAIHHESQSVGRLGRKQQRFYEKNRLRFVLKHTPAAAFSAEFVPAESSALRELPSYAHLEALRLAYLHALASDPPPPVTIRTGLQRLLKEASHRQEALLPDLLPPPAPIQHRPLTSSAPLLGPLIAALRNGWNNVAARWYARLLFDQQEAINRSHARTLQTLNDAIHRLLDETEAQRQTIAALRAALQEKNPPADPDQPEERP